MNWRIFLSVVAWVLGAGPGCSWKHAVPDDTTVTDTWELTVPSSDGRGEARGVDEKGADSRDSSGALRSEMVLSYLACRAEFEPGWDCCQFEDGLWVLKDHDDCPDIDAWCDCDAGFDPVIFSEPGCKWGVCVPGYPGTCEPTYLIVGEDSQECHDCPPEAPFWCSDEDIDDPCGFCTDCPCPMLEGAVGKECDCGCSCGILGAECYEDKECPNNWCIPHDDSWTGKLCGFT